MSHAKIFDISEYQEDYVDFEKAYADGYRGVILRTSIGLTRDKKFDSNYYRASKTPLAIGAYHAFVPWVSGGMQGTIFHDSIDGRKLRLYRWWDVELPWNGVTRQEHSNKLRAADEQLGSLSGAVGEGIYTSVSKWLACVGGYGGWARKKRLWVANYGVFSPALPSDWTAWDIWQYKVGKISWYRSGLYNIDLDYFNGDDAAFAAFLPPPELPAPLPEVTNLLHDQLVYNDILLQSGTLDGSNTSGVPITVPNLPLGTKGIKVRLVSTSNRMGAMTAVGSGTVGNSRFKVDTRQQVACLEINDPVGAEPYAPAHGDVMLDGDKVYLQWDAKGGAIKYWIYLQGYKVEV